MLSSQMATGRTVGNFNNQIGLPLSILALPDSARVAVLEIGMNHAGEIRHLARIVQPIQIGVVTNVGSAHVENFDSIEGVALAKRELIEALPRDGVAVLNADDPRVVRFREVHPGRTITFGLSNQAEIRASDLEVSPGQVRFTVEGVPFESGLGGRHGVLNILAGLAVARVFGIPAERLRDVVRGLVPASMRGQRIQRNGITVFDDCYNSNPEAVRSMIDLLRAYPARRRIAVLGEMLELGRWSESLHREVGRCVAESGISVLVGIRGAACHMVDEALRAGLKADAAFFFDDPELAGEHLRLFAREGDAILFKGSRGTRVEKALEMFLG
jgi:UDP-N-acetylmuramoyl-tripeptide--D-alanyl-D-alanine ligase